MTWKETPGCEITARSWPTSALANKLAAFATAPGYRILRSGGRYAANFAPDGYVKKGTPMAMEPLDREVILQTIENWPIDEQVALARTILERAVMGQRRTPQEQSARSTWDALYGIASNGHEPPTDEQVVQWLEERQDR